jgi:hypothetical protein
MTPEEFKAKYIDRLAQKYLREPDKVTMASAYQALSQPQKDAIQRAFESENFKRAVDFLQDSRKTLALSLADTRLDEITADGNINLETEIDELL